MAAITELIRAEPSMPTHHKGLGGKICSFYLTCLAVAPASSFTHHPKGLWVSYMCMYCLLFTILYHQLKGIYRSVQTSRLRALDSSEKGEELQEKHFVGVLPLSITTWHAGNSKCYCRAGWVLTGLTQKEEQLREKTNNFLLITPCWQKARFS